MQSIHADFRKIFTHAFTDSNLNAAEAALFGVPDNVDDSPFLLDSAYQGQEALELVERALTENRPYAMAFVDMRMPPGWDGVQTIERLWQCDGKLQVVICTAYSDHSWNDIFGRLDVRDRLLVLKKPFDPVEARQLAVTLAAKWDSTEQANQQLASLEAAVQERTSALTLANEALTVEITERKLLESQLIQSEKLSALGQLAAGMAHEINNPVGFVRSNFESLQRYVTDLLRLIDAYRTAEPSISSPDTAAELAAMRDKLDLEFLREDIPTLLHQSLDGIDRIRGIVQDLKDFSRSESSQGWSWADLHQGIDSTLKIAASELRTSVSVVKEYATLPLVQCLPAQINQVVLNLLVNAAHAISPARGVITITTRTQGEDAVIEVRDTGRGIDPEVVPRIFDPFFTTKPVGQGTGLGLSVSYGIAKKHNGRIEVESVVGEGTVFRLVLPIFQPNPVPNATT